MFGATKSAQANSSGRILEAHSEDLYNQHSHIKADNRYEVILLILLIAQLIPLDPKCKISTSLTLPYRQCHPTCNNLPKALPQKENIPISQSHGSSSSQESHGRPGK
jgi:hypothetical protein